MEVRGKGGHLGGPSELCWGRGEIGRENLSDSIREGEGNMVGLRENWDVVDQGV